MTRLSNLRAAFLFTFTIAYLTFGLFIVDNHASKTAADRASARTAHTNCVEIQKIKQSILNTTQRTINTIPTLAYYKDPRHKQELANALYQLYKQQTEFAVRKCP